MSSNKTIRQELERICGKGCFFQRAHCAERIEAMGGIKTFKKFVRERKFKGKKISYQITFHHLQHTSDGGATTVENGANVAEIAHQYIHSLPREQEEIVNDMLKEFKLGFGILSTNEGLTQTGMLEINFNQLKTEETLIIPVYDCTKEQFEEMKAHNEKISKERKKKEKIQKLKNPTRAMQKRELQKLIEEEEEDWDR